MKSIQLQYATQLFRELGYWGTWLPSNQIRLGDIGIFKKGCFHRVSSLEAEQISFNQSIRSGAVSHQFMSKGAVNIQTKLSGDIGLSNSILSKEDAGINIEFKSENAIYFKVEDAKTSIVDGIIELESEILQLFEVGRWQKDWVFVNELVTAKECIVLVSDGKDAKVEFKVGTDSKGAIDVKLGAHHKMVHEKSMGYKMLAHTKTTPLFKMMGLSSNWIGSKRIIPKTVQFEKLLISENQNSLIEIEPRHISDLHISK